MVRNETKYEKLYTTYLLKAKLRKKKFRTGSRRTGSVGSPETQPGIFFWP